MFSCVSGGIINTFDPLGVPGRWLLWVYKPVVRPFALVDAEPAAIFVVCGPLVVENWLSRKMIPRNVLSCVFYANERSLYVSD